VDFLARYQDFRILVVSGESENDAKQFNSLDKGLTHIKSFQKEKQPCWVDIQNIDSEDLKLLEAGIRERGGIVASLINNRRFCLKSLVCIR